MDHQLYGDSFSPAGLQHILNFLPILVILCHAQMLHNTNSIQPLIYFCISLHHM